MTLSKGIINIGVGVDKSIFLLAKLVWRRGGLTAP